MSSKESDSLVVDVVVVDVIIDVVVDVEPVEENLDGSGVRDRLDKLPVATPSEEAEEEAGRRSGVSCAADW